jgi:hypothetical protein
MVARNEEDTVARAQLSERRHGFAQLRDRTIHEISRDGDDVRGERVGPSNDVFDERASNGRPDVNVCELHDAQAVLAARQPGKPHAHVVDRYRTERGAKGCQRRAS